MMAFSHYDTAPFNRTSELSFRNMLEGWVSSRTGKVVEGQGYMHNLVHNFLNGTMSIIEATANDPIFFLHHCFIDSLMERWLRKHMPYYENYPDKNAPIGHSQGYHMVPFLPMYRNIEYLLSKNLGDATETRPCYNIRGCCNLKGKWGDWSDWSKCRPSCGSKDSKRYRERLCDADYAASGYTEAITFHGIPDVNCGELPEFQTKEESKPCDVPACLEGRRFV